MHRLVVWVVVAGALLLGLAMDTVALSATHCLPGQTPHYVSGFAELHARLAAWMGEPVTCEFPDPNNSGDVHQQTTVGLAFWRKSTNTPTFTDGYNHWALTSSGLVTWTGTSIDPPESAEPAAPNPATLDGGNSATVASAPSFASPPPTYPTRNGPRTETELRTELTALRYSGPWDVASMLAAYERAAEPPATAERCFKVTSSRFVGELPRDFGEDAVEGVARNVCSEPIAGTIKLSRLSPSQTGGRNVGDLSFEISLGTLPPEGTTYFQIPVRQIPRGTYWWDFAFSTIPVGSAGSGLPCWTIRQSEPCIDADFRLQGALVALNRMEIGRKLQRTASEFGVVVMLDHLAPGTLGTYSPATRTLRIDDRLLAYGDFERAAVLAHELQHAADHAQAKLGNGAVCFGNEEDAFRRQGEVWTALWNNDLPHPENSLQAQLNDIAVLTVRDPLKLIQTYLAGYGHECGSLS
jgi:hypothetical protein